MYARAVGHRKLMAFLPAAFAIAIYQQLLMALAMAFLIHLALLAFRKEPALGRHAAAIAAVNLLAIATYALGARLFLAIYATTPSPYITGRVELATLTSDPVRVLRGTMDAILAVYLGRTAAYGLRIPLMGILIGTALVGFAAHVWGLQRSPTVKLGLFATALLIMLPPFGLGALTGGVLRMRWLPSLPMAVAGVTLLATLETRRGYQFVLTGVVAFAVFQFIQATNRLFASSYLALEADRVLAARIIDRLEAARTSLPEGSRPVYLQIVGYLEREPTELMPRAGDTVGYSIFESADTTWIAAFLGTLDYREMQPMPPERQFEMIEQAKSMPAWPEQGGLAVMGDTVLVNLGGQTAPQKFTLCRQLGMAGSAEYDRLCGNETWRPGLSDQ
jgi:hypothetical protein